jgi:hypothetical protein
VVDVQQRMLGPGAILGRLSLRAVIR